MASFSLAPYLYKDVRFLQTFCLSVNFRDPGTGFLKKPGPWRNLNHRTLGVELIAGVLHLGFQRIFDTLVQFSPAYALHLALAVSLGVCLHHLGSWNTLNLQDASPDQT